jgi:hypothetical protein
MIKHFEVGYKMYGASIVYTREMTTNLCTQPLLIHTVSTDHTYEEMV